MSYKFTQPLLSPAVVLRTVFNIIPQQNENSHLLLDEQIMRELSTSVDGILTDLDLQNISRGNPYRDMGIYPGHIVFRSKGNV